MQRGTVFLTFNDRREFCMKILIEQNSFVGGKEKYNYAYHPYRAKPNSLKAYI